MVDSHKRDIKIYLKRILQEISKIESYTDGIDFDVFEEKDIIHNASLMQLIQIGEISMQIKHHYPDYDIANYQDIKSMRNFLVHAYHKIDLKTVWDTIIYNLPRLKETIEKELSEDK